jgi:hypothetical protein
MKMKINSCILFCSFLFLLSSCYYDKEVLIYGTSACDTTNVKFSVQISGTLSANCLSCHGGNAASGGGIQLGSYDAVKVQALNGKLIGVVSQSPGFATMPKGGAKLPECRIAEIRTWIRNGMPNN